MVKILAVPHIRYMGKGTECLQKMREEFEAEIEGIKIPTTQSGRGHRTEKPPHDGLSLL